MAWKCCISAYDKAKLFAKNFSKDSNLDDSCISLPVFPSRTNLKLNSISVTPKVVKKVITNLSSKIIRFIKGILSRLYSSGASKEL